jgi:TonB family protein
VYSGTWKKSGTSKALARVEDPIDLMVRDEEQKPVIGLSLPAIVSLVLHVGLLIWFIHSYRPAPRAENVPIARYVELIKQNPQDFVEAPGRAVPQAPLHAPLSDANRKAAMPEPTGPRPTQRPGDGGGLYTPQSAPGARSAQSQRSAAPQLQQPQQQQQQQQQQPQPSAPQAQTSNDTSAMTWRQPRGAQPAGSIDWNHALDEVGKYASLGGPDSIDLGRAGGGEKGTAEQGPLSFETQWYDWGPYAQSMVSRIRVNWYGNMPQLIRTGMKGAVTIRFTIHRDGRISDVTILKSSGVPPYDYAAQKAIELSSPLNPLPKDFPNASERVTAIFFYNMDVPAQ